jgi:hypothetical protein
MVGAEMCETIGAFGEKWGTYGDYWDQRIAEVGNRIAFLLDFAAGKSEPH